MHSKVNKTVQANPRLQEVSGSTENSSNLASAKSDSGVRGLLRESAGGTSGRFSSVTTGSDGSSTRDSLGGGSGGLSNASRAVPVITVGLASAGGGFMVVVFLIVVAVGCGCSDQGRSRSDNGEGS